MLSVSTMCVIYFALYQYIYKYGLHVWAGAEDKSVKIIAIKPKSSKKNNFKNKIT